MTISKHLSYANVLSTVALVLAVGTGTTYAAEKVHLPKNSVGSKQLKAGAVQSAELRDGAVGGGDLADGAVTGGKLADGAVTEGKLAAGTLSALSQPRAYGVLTKAGTLVAARSKNVTVTDLPGAGLYCVTPTPASGIDATKTTIVATPEWSDGTGIWHIVQVFEASSATTPAGCPGGFELVTDNYSSGFTPADVAVSFVIP